MGLFPEFVRLLAQRPGEANLGTVAVVQRLELERSPWAAAVAQTPIEELQSELERVSAGRWGPGEARLMRQAAQHQAAQHSLASSRAVSAAVSARGLVVRTCGPLPYKCSPSTSRSLSWRRRSRSCWATMQTASACGACPALAPRGSDDSR